MNVLLGLLFMVAAIIPFYLSEKGRIHKILLLRTATIIFALLGFNRIIAYTKMSGIPEAIPPNVMYGIIVVIFGIGPEILEMLRDSFEYFMERFSWKNAEEK